MAVHVAPGYYPCSRCREDRREYPNRRSAYFAVARDGDGSLTVESVSWASYQKACRRAAEALKELVEKKLQECLRR
ncbi:hypothetical protein [Desulfothermobacter acidiphilus]|uniref:hypothetical protein n=1 Tax=Desulfothermobacter acidiphilus TaxID=1938353 RepID=UPI003F88F1E9